MEWRKVSREGGKQMSADFLMEIARTCNQQGFTGRFRLKINDAVLVDKNYSVHKEVKVVLLMNIGPEEGSMTIEESSMLDIGLYLFANKGWIVAGVRDCIAQLPVGESDKELVLTMESESYREHFCQDEG